jgi:hypothetical protein
LSPFERQQERHERQERGEAKHQMCKENKTPARSKKKMDMERLCTEID